MDHAGVVSRRARWLVLLFVWALGHGGAGGASPVAPDPAGPTAVILLRHAEKADQGRDPALSQTGKERAEQLARLLGRAEIAGLYASQFRRTQETLAPLAGRLGLEVQVVPVEGSLPDYARTFAARLRTHHRGGTVVVVGHSNTIPELLAALGIEEPPEITDEAYGDLFIVLLDGATSRLLRLTF